MIPSLVKKISKSLSLSRTESSSSAQSNSHRDEAGGSGSLRKTGSIASVNGTPSALRRQSTKQISSDEETVSGLQRVTGRSSITKIRTSSIVREVSNRRSSTLSSQNSRKLSKRLSKAPVRLVEEDEATLGKESSPSKSHSRSSNRSFSSQGGKTPPLNRLDSKVSLTKKTSTQKTSPAKEKKESPGGKELWFSAGAYLTVRNEEGGFFLCRAVNNIYNTSKTAKVRWLGPKSVKKTKRGGKPRPQPSLPLKDNAYELMYKDELDPAAVIMEVEVERHGTTFTMNEEDKEETERLMQVAEDVESGKMDKSAIGDDVEEAIQIDYEPAAKRSKPQTGASPKAKPRARKATGQPTGKVTARKPRLKKTASQKDREKAKKIKEREEKKQKAKEKKQNAAEERKRKKPKKVDDMALHPNPAVKVLEKDPLWDTNCHMPYVSKYSNSRLAFRALNLNDMKLLKKLLKDPERIHFLTHQRSVMLEYIPLEHAVKLGRTEAVNLLMEDAYGTKYIDRRKKGHFDRLLFNKLGTGSYNYRSLGVNKIRPLMASRGAREGNNALIKDQKDNGNGCWPSRDLFSVRSMLMGASKEILTSILSYGSKKPSLTSEVDFFISNIPDLLARGFNEQVGEMLKLMETNNQLNRIPQALSKVLLAKDLSEMPSVPPSAIDLGIKKLKGFTMLHVAASNPNPDVLEKILNSDPNFMVSDVKGKRPIHIAAGCSSTKTLQLLLDKGGNPFEADNDGFTALHFAIRAGRTKNVNLLLKMMKNGKMGCVDPTAGKPNGGVNRNDKKSRSPLHMACADGNLDIVKLLVEHGANLNIKTSINDLSVTPLMFAAGAGHLNIVRHLVDAGAIVEFKDRVGRTALMHAAMNGSTSVMSYLLHIGASPTRKDTSGNTPLHYAAAYGWYFSVKLLLESGAVAAVSNDWTTSPLAVAYLKGHEGIVSLLLDDDTVDVNFPNEDGETLLFFACSCEKDKHLLEQIRYLVKDKGANCSVINSAGQTALHYVADTAVYIEDFYEKDGTKIQTQSIVNKETSKVVLEIAKMLVEKGCDVSHRSKDGMTAAMLALRQGNIELAQYLVEKGGLIYADTVPGNDNDCQDTLLHSVAYNTFNDQVGNPNNIISFLNKTWMVNGQKKTFRDELLKMAQTVNQAKETPLLIACRLYSTAYFNSSDFMVERSTALHMNAFDLIKSLVEVAKSDVNATNREDSSSHSYLDKSQAWWAPVFFMIKANDPYFDKAKKYDSTVKGKGLRYLISQGAKVDIRDESGRTPLTYCLFAQESPEILRLLVEDGGADINQCKLNSVTETVNGEQKTVIYKTPPLCYAALLNKYALMGDLLKHGTKVDAINEQNKETILHLLAVCRSNQGTLALMEKMIQAGAKVNACDGNKRTALHLLVNCNKGNLDDSFEEEILLISKKANLTLQDFLGRTPLHYVFVKHDRTGHFSGDPVDLCKLLVKSMKAADLNIADNDGCTPLHYAAKHGASICCMYLLEKGAKPDVKDKIGNTPLAYAVQSKHDSCGCIFVQHGADLLSPVVFAKNTGAESNKDKSPTEWNWKPMAVTEPEEKTEVPLFKEAIKQGLVGVSFLILEWPVEKSGVTLVDAIEMAVQNSQFNVALRFLSTALKGSAEVCAERELQRNLLHVLALSADPSNNSDQQLKIARMLIDKGVPSNAKDKYKCTPLCYAAYNKNWPLAQIFFDLPGHVDVKAVDSFQRNLIATSMWKLFFSEKDNTWSWLDKLITKGFDINRSFDYPLVHDLFGVSPSVCNMPQPDYWKNYPDSRITPLILALHCHVNSFEIIKGLLKSGANPNLPDGNSLTPLMHAVKLNVVSHVKQLLNNDYNPSMEELRNARKAEKQIVQLKRKFQLKAVQSSDSDDDWSGNGSCSEEEDEENDEEEGENQKTRSEKQIVPLKRKFQLKTVRSSGSGDDWSGNGRCSEEEDEENDEEEGENQKIRSPKEYIPVQKTSSVNLNATDRRGWTALHYVSHTMELGTFDSEEMVFLLGKAGAKLDIRNLDGQTPLDLALASGAPRVAAMLQTLMGVDKKVQKEPVFTRADPHIDDGVARHITYDFHADAEKQMVGEEEEMEEEETYEPPVSNYCNVKGVIARDEEQDLLYEVLMTKCDSKMGEWGLYNFYQMQIVHQTGQDLHVLFTRWGRMGDSGQYQHTPFNSKEDAVKEFCKIFKSKSGNLWSDVKTFEPKPRKYHFVPVEERRPPKPQKKVEFDFSTKVKSTLPKDIHKAMEIMMNIEKLKDKYHSDINVDTNILPFGRFSRERLLKANQLLDDMRDAVNQISKYRYERYSEAPGAEDEELYQQNCQKVGSLSTEYFRLIPRKDFVYEKLRPLDQVHHFTDQYNLITNLLDFDVSTKMMLGAMNRKRELHPLDYVYNVMKCKLELMEEDDPMTQHILRYAGASSDVRLEAVYKVEREGEDMRFQKCGLGNRRFLWHGTCTSNIVSILNRGLVSSPLDAHFTAAAFGKGIYFADRFDKSEAYSDSSKTSSSFVLLCEVALGKQKLICAFWDDENIESGFSNEHDTEYNSSLAQGYSIPDPKFDVRLPSGEIMPLGSELYQRKHVTADGLGYHSGTDRTEYIVYSENQVCIRYLVQYRSRY